MLALLARLAALPRSHRLRVVGWVVLACGLACSVVFYWLATRNADPELNDVTALGYKRSLDHGMGVMMGQFGIILTEWQETLTSAGGKALIIAACAALLAGCFFRVAWVIDQEQR